MTVDYLAGIIDGDGCVSITRITRDGKSPRHEVRIIVTAVDECLIKQLIANFGGFATTKFRESHRHRQAYAWVLRLKATDIPLLAALSKCSLLKKPQLSAAIEMLRRVGFKPAPGKHLPSGEIDIRDSIKMRVNKANAETGCPHVGSVTSGYVAGFFDAEGAVEILPRRDGQSYRVVTCISNECRCVLGRIQSLYGGSIGPIGNCHRLTIAAAQAHRLLVDIVGQLVTKQARVRLAVAFRSLVAKPGSRVSDAKRDAMQDVCTNMARLNLRGNGQLALLKIVKRHESNPRVTHCLRGHEYSAENTYHHMTKRYCRACHRESRAKRKAPAQALSAIPKF